MLLLLLFWSWKGCSYFWGNVRRAFTFPEIQDRNGPVPSKKGGMTSSPNPIGPGSQSAEPGDPNGKFFLGKRDIIREMPRFLQESALISYNREGGGGGEGEGGRGGGRGRREGGERNS